MAEWRLERQRVEGLLRQCLTPAIRPPDAGVRPVVEAPSTLSYSMLSTYLDCSRKAYLRFLAGFPGEPVTYATGPGSAFHAAMEALDSAQRSGQPFTFDQAVEAFEEAAAGAHGTTSHRATQVELAMLRQFWTGPDRAATPLLTEAEFYWRVGPGYLHGFIDRVQRCPDGAIELIDFKTSKSALTEVQVRDNLQLLIYALAVREVYDVIPDRLTLVYPRLGSRVSVSFSESELRAARARIVDLMEWARTASYADVNTAHCRSCEYRLICPAARDMS